MEALRVLEETAARLWPLLKSALPGAVLPLLARGPGRPPLDDDPETVLLHERRREIFRLVQKEPGLPYGEIRERLKIPSGAFYHHVQTLARVGLVEKRDMGSVTRIYPAQKAPPLGASPLANENADAIARLLLKKPGVSSREIAEALEKPQRTIQGHLRNLVEEGYVDQEKGWDAPLYSPTRKLRETFSRK